MKHIKKIVICIIILIFSSGCTVNYDLEINKDESVLENVEATELTKIVKSKTNLEGENAVDYLFNMFNRGDDQIKVSSKEENGQLVATAYRSYSSLIEYSNYFDSDLFDDINITRDGKKLTITAQQSQKLGGVGKTLVYDDVSIRIKSPFMVTDNNADEIEGSTYIWNIKKGEDLKTIKYTINVKDKKNSANIDIGKKTVNINYGYIAIGIFTIAIVTMFIIVLIKNKKNNVL